MPGHLRYAIATDGVNQTYLYRASAEGPFKPVLTTTFRDQFAPQFFTADNRKLYVASNLGRDKAAIVLVDPSTAKEEKIVYARDDVDVAGLVWSKARKRPAYAAYQTWKNERHYLDPDAQQLFTRLEEKLPGYEVIVQSTTDDESGLIVAATSDRTQGARYRYDRKRDHLTKLGDVTPWLPEAQMAAMKPIEYRTRDGLTVNGYLTLPKGVEPRGLPVIVNPHGGPWARDGWGFNPEVQFLANRGYAVLQINYRGSTGYGRKFWEASFKQWGFTMQDDITDGVEWLVKEGIADPKRVCIYGGSYGGYATLEGLVKTPDLYACGVDYVGVSNLFTFMKTIPPYWKPFLGMMQEMVGDPEKDKERLAAASPALHADRIKAPLLIAQGARDPRVNKDESDQMVAALKARGIDVPVHRQGQRGPRFSQRGKPVRVLRGDGAISCQIHRQGGELTARAHAHVDHRSRRGCRRTLRRDAEAIRRSLGCAGACTHARSARDARRGYDRRRARARRHPLRRMHRIATARPAAPLRRCDARCDRRKALHALADRCHDDDWILVHDAARPCVPPTRSSGSFGSSPTTMSGACSRCRSPTR